MPIIKDDIINAVNAFVAGDSRNLGLLNNALIVLLPKTHDACEPKDYRPITLVHSFGKLLSKLLSIRLAPELEKLIANQNAYIKGRTIQDKFKYVQRAAVLLRKKKIPKLLLKLDISKALDTVPFLGPFYSSCSTPWGGLGIRWRRWIAAILSSWPPHASS